MEEYTTYRIIGGARGIEPFAYTLGAYRVFAWEADFPFDGTGLRIERVALCEADHAGLVAAGIYAILVSEQLAAEKRCHCMRLQGSLLARWNLRCVDF